MKGRANDSPTYEQVSENQITLLWTPYCIPESFSETHSSAQGKAGGSSPALVGGQLPQSQTSLQCCLLTPRSSLLPSGAPLVPQVTCWREVCNAFFFLNKSNATKPAKLYWKFGEFSVHYFAMFNKNNEIPKQLYTETS